MSKPALFAAAILSTSCMSRGGSQSSAPTTPEPSTAPATPDEDKSSRVRDVTGTRMAESIKGVKLKAKKPPRGPAAPDGTVIGTGQPLALTGIRPTAASPGSAVELLGSGFGADPKAVKVTVGGKSWKVLEASDGRVIAEVPKGAKAGTATVKVGGKSASGTDAFAPLVDDGGFLRPAKDARHGLIGKVFDIGKPMTGLPDFDDVGQPIAIIALDQVDVPSKKFDKGFPGKGKPVTQLFAIQLEGSLNVTEAAEYGLCITSDDGAHLYLDGQLVVDNDGVHIAQEKCETVYMDPGEYEVDILYFQGEAGDAALQWSWSKGGGAKEIVPAAVLFRP